MSDQTDTPASAVPATEGDVLPADRAPTFVPGRGTGIGLAVLALIGLAAAFTLAAEKVHLLEDPSYDLSCNFSPILACGSVMTLEQASAFWFPNPFLGIGAFPVVLTLGVLIAGGVRLPRWTLDGLAIGSLLGVGFVGWLVSQSLYEIGALCPWCMCVWAVTIPIAVWSVLIALRSHFPDSEALEAMWDGRFLIVLLGYVLIIVLAGIRFADYWRSLV